MRDKLWKKLTVLFLVVSLVIPALPAGAAQEDLKFYGKDGFILTVEDGVTSENLATNKLKSLTFLLEYSEDGDDSGAEDVDENDVIVTYEDRKISDYTIEDIRFDKPGEVELDVDIEGKTGTEFEGLSDTITIQLNYFNFDVQGAKFYTDFLEDKPIAAFGDRIQLKFPKGSYITNTGQSTGPVAPNQEILFAVDEIKDSLNEDENDSTYGYVFLTNSFEISHDSEGLSAAQPSYPGYITIKYGYDDVLYKSGMISSEVAMYNVTVVKYDKVKDRWIPIGGIVDSKKQTIMAPFDKFGTYAVALNTKTFNDLNDWSKPYVMALAYKGIVEQASDRNDGRLKNNLTSEINRYDFTVMLTKAMNWAPMNYNNYFDDVTPGSSPTGVRQIYKLPISGSAHHRDTLIVNFEGTLIDVPINKGDSANKIANKIKDEMRKDSGITSRYNVSVSGADIIVTGSTEVRTWELYTDNEGPGVTTDWIDGDSANAATVTMEVYGSDTKASTLKFSMSDDSWITDEEVVNIEVSKGDTKSVVAQKIETAIKSNVAVSKYYTVSRNVDTVTLKAKTPGVTDLDVNLVEEDTPIGVYGSMVVTSIGSDSEAGSNFSDGSDYIMAAVVNGLLQGELNTSGKLEMKPDNYLTREEAAVFATRALKLKVATYDTKNMEKINKDLNKMFTDADTISEWAKPYVQAVAKAKIMTGDEYGFRPHGELLFNEACALIYNIMMRNDLFGK